MTPALPSPLALVCHDAGPLQLILPWLDLDAIGVRAFLQGPALALWQGRFGQRSLVNRPRRRRWTAPQMLLSGTSAGPAPWNTGPVAGRAARPAHSVAVLDHWLGYAARFQRDGHRQLPDEVWVCDAEAYALARTTFPGQDVRLQPNLHLREQVRTPGTLPRPAAPGRAAAARTRRLRLGRGRPGEVQALDFLLAHAHRTWGCASR
jgi:hypothetical protein